VFCDGSVLEVEGIARTTLSGAPLAVPASSEWDGFPYDFRTTMFGVKNVT
jgi:hypothetical protein